MKRIFLEFLLGCLVMYSGCKIYPGALLPGKAIYLITGVVFALYCIRGYRITWGLLLGGVLAFYFSPETDELIYISSKLFSAVNKTVQILFCAFFIRFILDKFHMTLLPMRKLKEIGVYYILAILVPQLVFNLFMTPSMQLTITGLGHSVGLLTITCVFLIWSTYVPKVEPLPLSKKKLRFLLVIWTIMGALTYLYCFSMYNIPNSPKFIYVFALNCGLAFIYSLLINVLIELIKIATSRFFNVIGMGVVGLAILFYTMMHPEIKMGQEWPTLYIQITIIIISARWLKMLAKR